MNLNPVFERFVKGSLISVMARGAMERVLNIYFDYFRYWLCPLYSHAFAPAFPTRLSSQHRL